MKILLHLVHATPSVLIRYTEAMAKAGLDVDIVTVLPRDAEVGGLSSAYAKLCERWRGEGRTPVEGLRHDYPGPSAHYDAWVIAAWSAGYKLIELALQHHDSNRIDGIVMLDSGHAAFDADHTAADRQLIPFVQFGKRAMAGGGILWIGHTDVFTPQTGSNAFASTTQWAAELVRLMGLGIAPKRRGEVLAVPGFYLEVFDEKPANEAKSEHIGALLEWGPKLTTSALQWLAQSKAIGNTQSEPRRPRTLGERALEIAMRELGIAEEPLGSNNSERIKQYRSGCVRHGRLLLLGATPWCAEFSGWCDSIARADMRDEGLDDSCPVAWRAAVSELCADARKIGALYLWPEPDIMPGDLLIMKRNEQNPTLGGDGHVGRVESVDVNSIITIDGNHENKVARVVRSRKDSSIIAVIKYPRAKAEVVSTESIAKAALYGGLDRSSREALGG